MTDKILITGARSAVAIDMARSFRDSGYEIHMADCSSAYISRWSKIPECVHTYASPARNPEQFLVDLKHIADTVRPVMIIPTCEEVFYLSRLHDVDSLQGKIFTPPLDDLRSLHDKYTFIKICEQASLNVPETHKLENTRDIDKYRNNSKEWVFKPRYSRFGAETIIAPSQDRLNALSFGKKSSWVAQRYISGKEFSFYAIARAGKLTALSVYTSSWRLKGGASYVFEAVPEKLFEDVRRIAEKIAVRLNLTCQFACDLILDKDGLFWIIECNPRSTSGLHFLKDKLAKAFVDDSTEPDSYNGPSRYMLGMILSYGFASAFKTKSLRSWLETIWLGKDVIGAPSDRLPFFGAMLDTFIFMRRGIENGVSLTKATTADIEWNGEELP